MRLLQLILTEFSDTPAVDSGVKQAQVFVGRDTLVADAYPMKSGKQFVIQFPPEMDENWLRNELAKLGQISRTKLAEDAVLCVHNTASALNS